jgi:hypothetical protein
MRILWTTVKLVIALVIVVPISTIVLALTLGLFGALVGLLSSMFRRGLTSWRSAANAPDGYQNALMMLGACVCCNGVLGSRAVQTEDMGNTLDRGHR